MLVERRNESSVLEVIYKNVPQGVYRQVVRFLGSYDFHIGQGLVDYL